MIGLNAEKYCCEFLPKVYLGKMAGFGKRVTLVSDGAGWALDSELDDLAKIVGTQSVKVGRNMLVPSDFLFFMDRYVGLKTIRAARRIHRSTGINFFHGEPRSGKNHEALFERMVFASRFFTSIRVSHQRMADLLIDAGAKSSVERIPIPVDTDRFPFRGPEARENSRRALGIPNSAFVVGSFQKDGEGWGEGMAPKLIKGPDVLVNALHLLSQRVPELLVLLVGPSRGYVVSELAEKGVSFLHTPRVSYDDMSSCYHALDAYLVSSRDEGGPMSVLESMASGVPLVSTPVGQALDLVVSGWNGWLSSEVNPEELSELLYRVYELHNVEPVTSRARMTAEENSLLAQTKLWIDYFGL